MEDLRQLLHEELDKIFDELSKRVDINNSARNISKLTEAAGITEPTSWMILYEDTFEEVKL